MLLKNFEVSWLVDNSWREVFAERKKELIIVLEQGNIEKLWQIEDLGTGIRTRNGDRFLYNYITSFDVDKILSVLDSHRTNGGGMQVSDVTTEYDCRPLEPYSTKGIGEKVDLLKLADSKVLSYGTIIAFRRIVYKETVREVEILNSDGFHSVDIQRQLVFYVQVAVSENDRGIETGYEPIGWSGGLEIFNDHSPEDVAELAVERAIKSLKSDWVKAGRMPVVISSEAGGTIIHEAVGHGLEGDLVFNKLSVYSGRLGEQVASPLVTILDDATLECYRGSFGVDDEGVPSQKTVLIENGILKGYMTDRYYAERLGLTTTGNGRRESYRYMPIVRMTNTFMLPGKSSKSDVINSVDNGLFVRKMGGGEVNTVTGDFVFEVLEANMIKHGRIAEPVRGVTLIGNGPGVLGAIDMVANDIGFSIGTCGKDGQGVPVTDGMPTIRIPELTVGGKVKN